MRNTILALLITLTSFSVFPEPLGVSFLFGGWSKHMMDGTYNERQNVQGLEINDWGMVSMDNSYNEHSIAVYYNLDILDYDYVSLSTRLGAMSGYGDTPVNMDVAPFINPIITIKPFKQFLAVDLGVIPVVTTEDELSAVFTANLRYSF